MQATFPGIFKNRVTRTLADKSLETTKMCIWVLYVDTWILDYQKTESYVESRKFKKDITGNSNQSGY